MSINLPTTLQTALENLVAQGPFESHQAAIIEGVRLLIAQERLRAEIQLGIDELDRGESYDEGTVFAEVDAVIDRTVAERFK